MEKQKLRSEIEDKYKWDLSSIYKSDNEFLSDLESFKSSINKLNDYIITSKISLIENIPLCLV